MTDETLTTSFQTRVIERAIESMVDANALDVELGIRRALEKEQAEIVPRDPEPPAQEPVAWMWETSGGMHMTHFQEQADEWYRQERPVMPLYTAPPDDEARRLLMWAQYMTVHVVETADISGEVKKDAADLNRQIAAYLAPTDKQEDK